MPYSVETKHKLHELFPNNRDFKGMAEEGDHHLVKSLEGAANGESRHLKPEAIVKAFADATPENLLPVAQRIIEIRKLQYQAAEEAGVRATDYQEHPSPRIGHAQDQGSVQGRGSVQI